MSEPKAQLVAPVGNISVPGINATGVITASSFSGEGGVVSNLTGSPNLNVGVVTASSFVGDSTGHAAGLTGTPNVNLGLTTSTGFVGDATGKAAGLTGTPNLNVGLVTGTSFAGNVTGDVTGNITGLAGSIRQGANLNVGVATGVEWYGDGSALTGAGSSAWKAQNVTASGTETIIDLSDGNLIYFDHNANTTVGFASTSPGEQITLIRTVDNSYTITWPDRVSWNGGTAPTLIEDNPRSAAAQIFHFSSADTGLTYHAWEEITSNPQTNAYFSWGFNSMGELGQNKSSETGGDIAKLSSPTQVGTDITWQHLGKGSGGARMAGAIKTDGTLWMWGLNNIGNLGQNNETYMSSPTQIGTGTDWAAVSYSNDSNTLAVKTDGTLWAWGYGTYGSLGINNRTQYSSPVQIPGTTWDTNQGKLAKGNIASHAIKTDGTLWAWGRVNKGQLGLNSANVAQSSPTQVGTETTWNKIDGYSHMVSVKTDGTLWTWGDGSNGQLAQSTLDYAIGWDDEVSDPTNSFTVAPGGFPSPSAQTTGSGSGNPATYWTQFKVSQGSTVKIYNWGMSGTFQVNYGFPDQNNTSMSGNAGWESIGGIPAGGWKNVRFDVNPGITVAVRGFEVDGTRILRQAFPSTAMLSSPTQLGTETTWASARSGNPGWSLATKTDGTLWSWGEDQVGRLGFPLTTPNDGTTWSDLMSAASGSFDQAASKAFQGSLKGSSSRLRTSGNGVLCTLDLSSNAIAVGSKVEVYAEYDDGAGNYNSTCTVTIDGTTYTSQTGGYHAFYNSGSLTQMTITNNSGTGRTYLEGVRVDGIFLENNWSTAPTKYSSPVQIGTNTNWDQIYSIGYAGFATKTDGTLWSWGNNDQGQLAQNDLTQRSSPVQIPGTAWTKIGGTGKGGCALQAQ